MQCTPPQSFADAISGASEPIFWHRQNNQRPVLDCANRKGLGDEKHKNGYI